MLARRVRFVKPLEGLDELVRLCKLDDNKLVMIKGIARRIAATKNDTHGRNCQDWVFDLLKELERVGVVDQKNSGYSWKKFYLEGKKEKEWLD